MNVIETELRKLYLRHIDAEKQAELNLWITEIEPVQTNFQNWSINPLTL